MKSALKDRFKQLDGNKKCYMCGQILSRDSYYKNNSRNDGLSGECKPCHHKRVLAWAKTPAGKKVFAKANSRWGKTVGGRLCRRRKYIKNEKNNEDAKKRKVLREKNRLDDLKKNPRPLEDIKTGDLSITPRYISQGLM